MDEREWERENATIEKDLEASDVDKNKNDKIHWNGIPYKTIKNA